MCRCKTGYQGEFCEQRVNLCAALMKPCKNGGSCKDNLNDKKGFTCECRANFDGEYCERGMKGIFEV